MRIAIAALCAAFAAGSRHATAQPEKLGTISFPNSGNESAQAPFIRGMLLYHSFEYARAAESFRHAQKADPGFALAYWGEALTHTHQVWNQQNADSARAILNRLAPTAGDRRAKARTDREKLYLDVVEALYGEGSKPRRDTLFVAAVERVTREHPNDDEAKVLLALGLLGLNQGVRDFTTYMRAGAIAEDVLRGNPDHPGAAHFVIHAFDDPTHAPLGLWAARLYSTIAPGAPHAQHMTSHIFVALGMWDDVVSQNIIASGHDHDAWQAGHYTWWLGYGYTQQGKYAEAKRHLERLRTNMERAQRAGAAPTMVVLRAHYLIDSERWTDDVASWKFTVPPNATWAIATDSFVAGLAAMKRRDSATAGRLATFLSANASASSGELRDGLRVLEQQLRATVLAGSGRVDDAIALAKAAAAAEDAMPFEFGPPQFPKPPYELLGEILLAAGRADDARVAFQRSLARTPGRSRSLVGLARAAAAAGDRATAEKAVARLRTNWHAADSDLPERTELARLIAAGNR